MKQILTIVVSLTITSTAFSQAGQKWATSGNTISIGDFIGSTNNQPLVFRTNNNHQGMFTSNGDFQLTSLKGAGFNILQTDASGIISKFPMSSSNEVLFGDGIWRPLPINNNLWQQNGSSLYYLNGKVGIGTKTPFTNFDVIGDAYISNNLYVGGGIIITEKVNANLEMATAALRADSIVMDSTKAVYGYSIFKDQVKLENKLEVVGNTQINGDFRLNGDFIFGNNKRISFLPPSNGSPEIIGFGRQAQQRPLNSCLFPTVTLNQIAGVIQSFGNNGAYTNVMTMGFDGANGIIEMEGFSTGVEPRLLINYHCGKDIFMNTGANGGNVTMTSSTLGKVGIGTDSPTQKFEVAHNDGVGISAGMALTNLSTANKNSEIKFNQGTTTLWSVGNDVTHNNAQDFFIFDNVSYQTRFLIDVDGKTGIGTGTPTQRLEIAHADETGGININQVDQINNYKKSEIKFSLQGQEEWAIGSHLNGNDNSFFIWSHLASRTALYIAENGKVAIGGLTIPTGNSIYMLYVDGGIATRDIKVTANVFPDYVFASDYKLTPIEELERYIKKHHHLPYIQSAKEVEKNDGFEIGDMQIKLLKTVEEQTLYIIDLQKQLNELKNKVNELNTK